MNVGQEFLNKKKEKNIVSLFKTEPNEIPYWFCYY